VDESKLTTYGDEIVAILACYRPSYLMGERSQMFPAFLKPVAYVESGILALICRALDGILANHQQHRELP